MSSFPRDVPLLVHLCGSGGAQSDPPSPGQSISRTPSKVPFAIVMSCTSCGATWPPLRPPFHFRSSCLRLRFGFGLGLIQVQVRVRPPPFARDNCLSLAAESTCPMFVLRLRQRARNRILMIRWYVFSVICWNCVCTSMFLSYRTFLIAVITVVCERKAQLLHNDSSPCWLLCS